ncbi:Uncharacterized protein OBRU01_01026, partial [Operophtera brumata]
NDLKDTFEKIRNLSLDNSSWTQACLPVRFGGIGIRKISSLSCPPYSIILSVSVHSVAHLCGKILKCPSPEIHCALEAVTAWKSLCPYDNVPQEENQQK